MSIKSRLDYFLMRGGLLVKGDVCTDVDGYVTDIEDEGFACDWNKDEMENSKCHINSFAPRENNGSQPVPDDFPVIVVYVEGEKRGIGIASQFRWGNECCRVIKNWTPNAEKLIEQQIGYDKAKLKEQFKNGPQGIVEGLEQPIEELMINAKGNDMPVYTQEMKEAGKYAPIGSKVQIINNSGLDLEYGEDILGLEVTVKSEPIYIGLITKIQVVQYAGIAYCFETDMIFPFKSKEEIEMEDAKAKQVGDFYEKYESHRHFVAHGNLTGFIRLMQENGDLAEIILPLESN